MADSKSKKPANNSDDIEHLKSDIASFASSLGLATSLPPSSSSGFNDVDFRKPGPKKPQKKPKPAPNQNPTKNQKPNNQNFKSNEKPDSSKPKLTLSSLEDNTNKEKAKNFEKFKNLPKLPLMAASNLGVWYEEADELEKKVLAIGKKAEVRNAEEWKSVVAKKRELGERLMVQYVADYESSKGKSGDIKLLLTTQRSGTASDKISAFSVLVGDNPIANMRSLDALIGMVTSKVGKRYAFAGFEALRELFLTSLLPDRKLKSLLQRPLDNVPETKDGYSLLLLWYWEECLKQRYERFVFALEEASRDMLPELKNKALKTIYVLLKNKSEQERRLLSAIVNKLGDPKNKGASDADFHLSNLLSDHPNMKAVVIDEVDSFLFRPRLSPQAKYHAVNFLSQMRLTHKGDGPKVAKRLIDVYFALFKVLITEAGGGEKMDKSGKAGVKKPLSSLEDSKVESSSGSHVELDSRLLSALLMGVNRAFPFVSSNEADDIVEVQTPMLFQLVHSKNFNVGVQALMLLDKISSKNQIVSDRFYRALYSKLLLPAAMNTSKAEMFIGLLLRAMKNDVNLKRAAAFAKRVLQVALQQPPQYACGCLFLLSEVLKARPPLWNMVLQNESVDDELEHFEDVQEDTNDKPTPVSEKQELDVELAHSSDAANSDHDSSEDDNDSPASYSEDEGSDEAEEFLVGNDLTNSKPPPTLNGQPPQVPSERSWLPGGYDPRRREPSYCNADRVSWWELTVLSSHVHPSVSTMAKTLLSGANIVYNGNPLNDLSLTAFLDKFMEKKPKQSTWHGGSQIEPAKKLDMTNQLIGPEIISLAEEDVAPEDLVFHKFYMNKMNSSKKPKKKKKKKATEDDEAAADLFDVDGGNGDDSDNEEIDSMLDSAGLSTEADGDYDYDDLDQVADEDDEDLVADVSDTELDLPSDSGDGEAKANSLPLTLGSTIHKMLAVFDKSVAKSPEALQSPQSGSVSALKDGFLAQHFASVHPSSVTVNFGSSGLIVYSLDKQNPLLPRLFAVVDDIFCLFQGHIENVALLKQQYGLNKTANEVIIIIEAYRTLRDRGPYPADQVVRDIQGKFAFILYDSASKATFVAADPDGNVPFFWGTDSEGHLVLADDAEVVKKGCGNSFAPFPKGCFFTSSGGLRSYEHPHNELKAVPRVDSSGQVCGANFKVDAEAKKESSGIPRVGSAANWSTTY